MHAPPSLKHALVLAAALLCSYASASPVSKTPASNTTIATNVFLYLEDGEHEFDPADVLGAQWNQSGVSSSLRTPARDTMRSDPGKYSYWSKDVNTYQPFFPNYEPPYQEDGDEFEPWASPVALLCGNVDTANVDNAYATAATWASARGFWDERTSQRVSVPARTCRRMACWNTSGMYICNHNHFEVNLHYQREIARFLENLRACCTLGGGFSGEVKTDQEWSVVIGYANCNDHADRDQPRLGGANPNGMCRMNQRRDDQGVEEQQWEGHPHDPHYLPPR